VLSEPVTAICTAEVHTVTPQTPLEEVMRELFAQSATSRAEAAEPGASRNAQAQDRAAAEAE